MERILTPFKMKMQYQQAKLIKLLKLLDYKRKELFIQRKRWNTLISITKRANNGKPRNWQNGSRTRFPHPRRWNNNPKYTKRKTI